MTKPLKIIFAGTPEISTTILQKILQEYNIDLVLTQPDRPSGRGKKLKPSSVKDLSLKYALEVFQPLSFRNTPDAIEKIKSLNPDIMIVVAYGLILPKEILAIPKLGCVNIHVSLLPKFRGAAPIQRAIIAGETKTGITIIQMDEGLDTGNILMQQEITINDTDTSETVQDKLAILGGDMIVEYLKVYSSITPKKQSDIGLSYAHKIDKSEAKINWHEDSTTLSRKIRGFNPAPGCFSVLNEQSIKIWQAKIGPNRFNITPGQILSANKDCILVACGVNTTLEIIELQESGKNRQSSSQYVLGHPNLEGTTFTYE
jgi:methionyl-tRNA formyltransferase